MKNVLPAKERARIKKMEKEIEVLKCEHYWVNKGVSTERADNPTVARIKIECQLCGQHVVTTDNKKEIAIVRAVIDLKNKLVKESKI